MKRSGTWVASVLLLAAACSEANKGGSDTADAGEPGEGTFCEVRDIFDASCVAGCHSASAKAGDLDLETDAHAALVGISSAYAGRTLVVAGDAEGSFLLVKLEGTQAGDEGDEMPPGSVLSDAKIETVRRWIDGGAGSSCDSAGTDGRYHPVGFDAPGEHGMAAKYQEDDCLGCHGADLTGGTAEVSCDSCHEADWRTTCTYCHGGTDNATGAPPEDISDETDAASTTFPEHTAHVTRTIHGAYDCVQCHAKPEDALDPGHFIVADDTPGVAEMSFAGGLSSLASYDGNGGCSNLYCHGDGRRNDGVAQTGNDYSACDSCHADMGDRSGWSRMSGEHDEHLEEGVSCDECHGLTVSDAEEIVDPDRHVDGTADVSLADGMTWDGASCTGMCHWETHYREDWE